MAATPRRYIVRELPWQRGSRRRLIDRYRFFYEANRAAERVSAGGRCAIVENGGVEIAMWLNGVRQVH